jgi:anti-sigma B factor antagonist
MEIKNIEGVAVIIAQERLDAVSGPELRNIVKKLGEKGAKRIILDMGKTLLLDSSGCGALVASLRSVAKLGGDLKILNPTSQPKNLLELMRLDSVFEVFEDLDRAVESFK